MGTNSKLGPQILAAFAATIGAFVLGNGLGWSSPALSPLSPIVCSTNSSDNSTNFKYCVDENESRWIGSLLAIGALIASQIVGNLMMPMLGPKWTMISMSIPAIGGWVCLMLPKALDDGDMDTIWLFYLGRILTGFGGGAFSLAAPLFVSEIAETRIRGALGALMQLQVTLGIVFVNALNIEQAVDWLTITGICIAFPVLMVVAMFFVPDSPVFLVHEGKLDAARKALKWLRGSQYDGVEDEIQCIQKEDDERNAPGSKVSIGEIFSQAVYLKPFGIAIALMFFQQFSGINEVLFYLTKIFGKAGSDMDLGLSGFIVTLVQVFATMLAVVLVDKLGRKILLISSSIIMCISIVGLGVYFYLDECTDPNIRPDKTDCTDISSLGWLPLTCLIVYIVGFSVGYGPIPWAMNAELFPKEAQGPMASLATLFNWSCAFIVSAFSQDVEDAIHASGLYFLFGAFNAAGIVFVLLFCPETKGKTPEDMKKYFSGAKQ